MMAVTIRGAASRCRICTTFGASKAVTSMGDDESESECRRHAGSTFQRWQVLQGTIESAIESVTSFMVFRAPAKSHSAVTPGLGRNCLTTQLFSVCNARQFRRAGEEREIFMDDWWS
jgi:hypothetical protein